MKQKIYFSGAIRGGREDAALYQYVIDHLKACHTVLTEHIGHAAYSTANRTLSDEQAVFEQDCQWMRECDLVVAECTRPSLGVGYELALAEMLHKPTFVFYRPSEGQLSAMILGNPYFTVRTYETREELIAQIDALLSVHNK